MQRRRVLQAMAAGAALGVAGCTGGGGDGGSGDDATASPSTTTESGAGTTADTPEETTSEQATTTATEETGGSEGPALGSLEVDFENNYRFSVTGPELDAPVTGAFNGEDFFADVTSDGQDIRTYMVDGDTYVVADGSCTKIPNSGGGTAGGNMDSVAGADSVEQDINGSESASVTPTGTTTIDGQEVYVYEIDDGETTVTYYIGVQNRRLRRVEDGETVIDYTDWGAVDPISAPC
jgi:hypothetical protein